MIFEETYVSTVASLLAGQAGWQCPPDVVLGCRLSPPLFHRRLALEKVFTSRLPRSDAAVTMVVAATAGRLHMLDGLCSSWGSIVSLAVHAPVIAGTCGAQAAVANVTEAVQAQFER